jgi:3-dehydroquinate synthase
VATIRLHLAAAEPLGPGGGDRSYDIHVGHGLLATIGGFVRNAGGTRAVVIADDAIAATLGAAVEASLGAAGVDAATVVVPSGEGSKSIAEAARLWDALAALAVDRRTHVVAVGGGVTGDLAGFVAATFGRGLPLWQVPTTVVAQVDSAIGGKTGINLDGGKNLVGAFWQPRGVVADVDTLATLPDREFVSGFAEVVKYGMILDESFFDWLEGNVGPLLSRQQAALAHAIERSAALKAAVVERDERETSGLRAVLNYGHTFAHAYETAAGYGTLLHGEAVAIGMARAARLALLLGRIPADVVSRQDSLLLALRLPIAGTAVCGASDDQLLAIMGRDKKTVDGRLRFVLPSRIGQVELVDGVAPAAVRKALAS